MIDYYKLSEVTEIIMGQAPPGESYNEEGLGVPLIGGAADLGDNYPNPKKYTTASSKLSKTGDIIMCIRATIGDLNWADKEYALGRGVAAFRVTEKISASYLYFWLLSQKQHFLGMGKGATFLQITKKDIEDTIIPLVDIGKQKQIGNILAKAQALVEIRKLQLEQLDLLVKSRFIEMFGNPVTNPIGWEVRNLKSLSTKILSGNTPKGGSQVYVDTGIIFFRSQNIWKNRIELDDVAYIDEQTHRKMSRTSLKNRDILITKTGRINTENSSLGRAALFLGEDDSANINGHVYLVRLKKGVIHEFVLYILISDEYRDYIREVCVGGIDKRQINKEHLEEFPIIMPPIDLQQRFADYVRQIDKLKSKMQQGLKDLESNFQALLQKAFKGELKVKDGVAV